jgi:hypothetical protein
MTFTLIALALSSILLALATIHFYWAAGGRFASSEAVPTRAGVPLFQPGPLACVAVGAVLLFAAALPLLRWRPGLVVLVIVFAARALGDFRFVGFTKSVRDSRFARLDTRVYSPLCVLLAALACALAFGG